MNWLRGNGFLLAGTLLVLAGTPESRALVVYGETNEQAQVDYTAGTDYLYATVAVIGVEIGSATYLGNGWFLTAYHVNATAGTTSISQNGCKTTIDYVSNYLNVTYGVDLKLVYCSDVSSLTSLTIASLPESDSSIWNSLKGMISPSGTVNIDGNPTTGYKLVSGTMITVCGNGTGRTSDSDLTAVDVPAAGSHAIRSGTAEILQMSNGTDTTQILTWATTDGGNTQCTTGDSGGSAYYTASDGTTYLIGTLVIVGNSDKTSTDKEVFFGDHTASISGNTVTGYSTTKYSMTGIVNLQSFADEILSIIKTNPLAIIPEPSFFSIFAGTLVLLFAGTRRRRERER